MGEQQQTQAWSSNVLSSDQLLSWELNHPRRFFLVEISICVKSDFTFDVIFCTAESICRQPDNEECQLACKAHKYELNDKGKVSYNFTPLLGRTLIDQSDLKKILDPYCTKFPTDVGILKDRMGQIIEAQNSKLVDKRMAHQLHSKCTITVQKQLSSGIYSGSFNTYQNVQLFSMRSDRAETLEKLISSTSKYSTIVEVVGWVKGEVLRQSERGSYAFSPSSSTNNILVICKNNSHMEDISLVEWWRDLRQLKIFREYHAVKAILELAKLLQMVVALNVPFVPISLEHVFIRRGNDDGFQIYVSVIALLQGLDYAHDINMSERTADVTETNILALAFPVDLQDPRPRIPGETKRAPFTLLSWFGLIVALIFFVDVESEDDRSMEEYSLNDCLSDPPYHLSNPVAFAMKQIVEACFKIKLSTFGDQIGILQSLLMTLEDDVAELEASEFDVGENDPEKRIVIIGKGGFATVYKAHHKGKRKCLALKQLRSTESHQVEEFMHEIMLLCKLGGNEHVVKLHGVMKRGLTNHDGANVFEDKDALHHVIMVSEYCSQGNLREFIDKCLKERQKEGFNYLVDELPVMIDILLGVCDGMTVLHEQNVFHRDLKPENVLLEKGRDGKLLAKVGDLGISRTLEQHRQQTESLVSSVGTVVDFRGSWYYLAPEVFLKRKCNLLTDVYSFAILMHDCLVTSDFYKKFSVALNAEERQQLQWVQRKFIHGVINQTVYPIVDGDPDSCFPHIPSAGRDVLESIMRKSWSFERKDRLPFSKIYELIEGVSESLG